MAFLIRRKNPFMSVGASGEKDNTVLDSVSNSNSPSAEKKKNKILDKIQLGLGIGGLMPGVGIVPDLINAGISGLRGNYGAMAGDLTAAIPLAGLVGGTTVAANRARKLLKPTKKPDIKIENPSVIGKRQKIPSLLNYPKQQPVISNVTKDGVATSISKQTGKVDAVVTGTDNKNVVGLYRDYVKGKPTNDFTSKMELTNPDLKKNFKTILNNTLEKLPKNHRLIEKTSVSLDGLNVWNKFVKSGKYKEAVDASGKVLTKKVHLGKLLEGVNKRITSKNIEELKKLIKQAKSKYPGIKAEIKKPWRNPVKLRGKNVDMGDSSIDIELPILVPK
tara:strand:- start:250 stop:1248 length:999 start_codon:yes stop_codon:yes gene_type:complete